MQLKDEKCGVKFQYVFHMNENDIYIFYRVSLSIFWYST